MSTPEKRKKVVVIGGGTGTFTLLQGLKQYTDQCDIVKIVSMADSGGATGRLRDQFGQLPVGDARMGLAALAADDDYNGQLLRELLQYRFHKGDGLKGHNIGNLLLVALTDMLGSEAAAIKAASTLLRLHGEVVPVTHDNVHLVATYEDGTEVVGEHEIDEPPAALENKRITELTTTPAAFIADDAKRAITEADLVIIGPGDLYASLLANCVVGGVPAALCESSARIIYVANLMSRPGQTRGMKLSDYVEELASYIGRKPDTIIFNVTELPDEALERYRLEGDVPVEDNLGDDDRVVRIDLLSHELIEPRPGDVLKRALIRHDAQKLASAIMELL